MGWDKLARKDWLDKSLTLNERLFRVRPLTYVLAATGLAVVALLLLVGTLGFDHSGVWAISLALGLSALGLFALGGYSEGGEAYLWVLGGCFCLMVAGVEFKFVADRMNTIFKVWMNGWVFMGLVFGAGLSTAFDKPAAEAALPPARTKARPKTKAKPRRVTPERFIPWAVALGTVVAVLAAAMVDAEGLSHGQRFIGSYLLFSLLLLAALGLGAWLRSRRLVAAGQARPVLRTARPGAAVSPGRRAAASPRPISAFRTPCGDPISTDALHGPCVNPGPASTTRTTTGTTTP